MTKITGTISGTDDQGKDWKGKVNLTVANNIVSGEIIWTHTRRTGKGYDGTETVQGRSVDEKTLEFSGVGKVNNRGRFKVVNSKHTVTLSNKNFLRLTWKGPGSVPDGEASGHVTIT